MENGFCSLCTVYHRSHRHNPVAARPNWVRNCVLEYFEVHNISEVLFAFLHLLRDKLEVIAVLISPRILSGRAFISPNSPDLNLELADLCGS